MLQEGQICTSAERAITAVAFSSRLTQGWQRVTLSFKPAPPAAWLQAAPQRDRQTVPAEERLCRITLSRPATCRRRARGGNRSRSGIRNSLAPPATPSQQVVPVAPLRLVCDYRDFQAPNG